jgi:hypothetical protein
MKEIYVKKQKMDFGDYVKCDVCGLYWNSYIAFIMFDHEFAMCPDCFDKFKDKIKKIG